MKNKIIIDVDTGIDDAMAIILAETLFKKNVLGITTCGGNVKIDDAVNNTLRIVEMLDWDTPVFRGAGKSIDGNEYIHAYDYHGTNGLGDVDLPLNKKEETKTAVDFIIESAETFSGQLDIICLAAPTNLAEAIIKKPSISGKISNVYMMGGAFNVPGNQTEYAEFNFFQDPKSIEIVLQNIKSVSIIPLDVTNSCFITENEASILDSKNMKAHFVKEAIINWYRFFGFPKKRVFELYDPLALTAPITDFLQFESHSIGINLKGLKQGEVYINGKYKVHIATSAKTDAFKKKLMEIIR